jgi:hypothetical protein
LDVNGFDIFLWVIAFLLLLVALYMLLNLARGIGDGYLAGLIALLCAAFCFIATGGGFADARHNAKDNQARKDFTAAGFKFVKVNRLHATMPIGNCQPVFDVRKINGSYRPVLPGYRNGKKYWAVLTPAWQKQTTCPA